MKILRLASMLALFLGLSIAQKGFAYDVPEVGNFSTTPFGAKLASKVGDQLQKKGSDEGLFEKHNGDGGGAIVKDPVSFQLFTFDPATRTRTEITTKAKGIYVGDSAEGNQLVVRYYFRTIPEFESWLARQSDKDMAGCQWAYCGTNSLNRERLTNFANEN
jgi:hypothetical protein